MAISQSVRSHVSHIVILYCETPNGKRLSLEAKLEYKTSALGHLYSRKSKRFEFSVLFHLFYSLLVKFKSFAQLRNR